MLFVLSSLTNHLLAKRLDETKEKKNKARADTHLIQANANVSERDKILPERGKRTSEKEIDRAIEHLRCSVRLEMEREQEHFPLVGYERRKRNAMPDE